MNMCFRVAIMATVLAVCAVILWFGVSPFYSACAAASQTAASQNEYPRTRDGFAGMAFAIILSSALSVGAFILLFTEPDQGPCG